MANVIEGLERKKHSKLRYEAVLPVPGDWWLSYSVAYRRMVRNLFQLGHCEILASIYIKSVEGGRF